MGKPRRLLAFALLGLLLAAAGLWAFKAEAPAYPFEMRTYVWQNHWTPQVKSAVAKAASRNAGYMVLVGEVDGLEKSLRLRPAAVDWAALAKTGKPVTLTLRANRGLLDERPIDTTAQFLETTLQEPLVAARNANVPVDGVQLDYDCPTAHLPRYATLVKALRSKLGDTPLSITALPTWLGNPSFKTLARQTQYYVLQVHSLDQPTNADAPIVLFDRAKLPARLKLASKLRVPYFVSLPTYGYRVAFDEAGHFTALGAENAPAFSNAKTVMADPEEMAQVVAALREHQPAWCRGIVWFRLPVDGDTLNWSWPTLESVMDGQVPSILPSVEMRRSGSNLFEVWMTNTAGYASDTPISIVIRCDGCRLQVSDALGAFEITTDPAAGTMLLQGPIPKGNSPAMVAWLRVDDETKGIPKTERVEWLR